MEDEYKVVYALSNSAAFNDLERPQTPVSRSQYTVSQKNRTLEIFSNISNKTGPISIIFGTENHQ